MRRKAAGLSEMPCITTAMPSSAARWATAGELRPERMPVRSPARCASTIPSPSRMWNALASLPSARSRTVPSVITPSTSVSTSLRLRQRAARRSDFIPVPPGPGSHHLRLPEVVEVDDALDPLLGVHDHQRRDLALLHEV